MQTKVKVQTVPYISTAHCTLAPYASAGVALRSNADESRELYGTFGKCIVLFVSVLILNPDSIGQMRNSSQNRSIPGI
jgi:hypothetical protein